MNKWRRTLKRTVALAVSAVFLAVSGCAAKVSDSLAEFHYGLNTQPAILDPLMSTATVTAEVSRLIFEPLLTQNEKFEVQPHVADCLLYTSDAADDIALV